MSLLVAAIDVPNRVALTSVTVPRELGKTLELATDLTVGARDIIDPTDTIRDGLTVKVDAP
jgi:hypothetical protein